MEVFLLLQTVTERDLIGAQLIRRNDEMSLLYEKMKIIEMTLHKGERMYNDRLEDIRLLKLEIRQQRCKNNMLKRSAEATNDLRLIDRRIIRPDVHVARLEAVQPLSFST